MIHQTFSPPNFPTIWYMEQLLILEIAFVVLPTTNVTEFGLSESNMTHCQIHFLYVRPGI